MPPKRKHQPSHVSQGSYKHPRLNPRFQRKDETEEDFPIDLSNPPSLPPRAIERVREAVEKKIEYGKKLVFRALKKAKGFEKQKLVKRLKIAREKGESVTVKKLEFEFEVLKTEEIDLNSLALNHILKTFFKSKLISASPLFPPWLVLQKEPEVQLDDRKIAKRDIIARLYNSTAVKEAVLVVTESVKSAMGIYGGDSKKGANEKEVEIGSDVYSGSEDPEEAIETVRLVKEMKISGGSAAEEGSESEEEEWGGISDSGELEDSEEDMDAFSANFEDRVARSSDEEEDQGPFLRGTCDEWSGEDDEESKLEEGGKHTQDAKPTPEKPRSGSKSKSKSGSEYRPEKPKPDYSAISTFLPTLMSGYISGSDSDIDADYYKDKNGKKKGPAQQKERKNRMGQQARRALWEKKFGKNANHVKKEEEEQGRKKIEKRIKLGRGQGGKREEDSTEKKGKNVEVGGPLHPSWEAARKAKEQQAKVQEAVMGKPMGKRIIFD